MRQQTRLIAGVLAAVTMGAAAVALGIALLLGNIVHLRTSANATLRTGTYLDATINLESKVVDAEIGLRGYVITGNRLFLAPTQAAESALPAATLALEQAAEREGAYVSRANALADAARFYMASYVPAVQRDVTTNLRAAQSFATTARGKQLVDGIRTQTEQLEHLISERQAARQRSAKSSANAAVTVAIVVLTALTLALGGFLGWLLVGRERARERAAFLAEAGTTLDRGTTSVEALETFATLVLARGNGYCAAEELGGATLESEHGQVQVLALAAMARGGLVARVVLARRGRDWRREEVEETAGLGTRLALTLQARALQARTEALYRRSDHIARTLQQSLLPTAIPQIPSCEVAIRFAPAGAGDLVGGDFYDVFNVEHDQWAIVIGDVCGKGPGAAAVTAMARWTLRSLAGSTSSPVDVLRSLS